MRVRVSPPQDVLVARGAARAAEARLERGDRAEERVAHLLPEEREGELAVADDDVVALDADEREVEGGLGEVHLVGGRLRVRLRLGLGLGLG